jgi:hypothetical protein
MPSSYIEIGEECLWFRDPRLGPLYAILSRYLRNSDGVCVSALLEKGVNSAMEMCGTGCAGVDLNKYANDRITPAFLDAARKSVIYLSELVNSGVETLDVSTLSDRIGTVLASDWYEYKIATTPLLQDATRLLKAVERYAESQQGDGGSCPE